ncbi:hypothetical protein FGO68_gene5920 [Halteria grandinella]|uniref:Uncharacterized protein n=1 Tax=Halteria grandinella TaxID=5974 RepID=A0A8J8NZB9_HALGN|nr:hypothetical protein FGO68_gene5920 [Halteria grandinella]
MSKCFQDDVHILKLLNLHADELQLRSCQPLHELEALFFFLIPFTCGPSLFLFIVIFLALFILLFGWWVASS